jgi:hypothetical protein
VRRLNIGAARVEAAAAGPASDLGIEDGVASIRVEGGEARGRLSLAGGARMLGRGPWPIAGRQVRTVRRPPGDAMAVPR